MKKLFTLLLSLMMILTLTACGSKEETPVAGANDETKTYTVGMVCIGNA